MERTGSTEVPSPAMLAKLEHDLALTRTDPLTGFDAERVLSRIEAAASALPRGVAPVASLWSPRRHVWLFAAALATLASAALLVPRKQAADDPAPRRGSEARSPAAHTAHAVPEPVTPPEATPPAEVREPARPPLPSAAVSSGKGGASDLRLEQELRQLARVRQALNHDPAGALSLADAGHREFKGGVMYEEREALAVMALSRLGSRAVFETRARRFLKAYPKSGFRERIAALLPSAPAKPAP